MPSPDTEMRRSAHLLTLLLFVCGCAGTVDQRSEDRPPLLALLDRVRANYAQMTTYVDSGRVVVPSETGATTVVTFRTEKRSPGELVFSYATADGQIAETLEFRAGTARVVGHEDSATYASLDDALSALTGVSSFSARVTPALLMGRDPCECLMTAPVHMSAMPSDPEHVEFVYRLRSGTVFSLVVSRRSALVQRAAFRTDGRQYDVVIDSATTGTLDHRPLPQETPPN